MLAGILESFSQLYTEAQLLSPEGACAMDSIVEWMRAYRRPPK